MSDKQVFESGYNTYGQGLGVMMIETTVPRPPGDVGNARTYDYPVFYEVVEGSNAKRVIEDQDPELLDPFAEAARNLIDRGAVAVTTSGGFLLKLQEELSARIDEIPVFTSSLLQIPLVQSMINPDQKIGILSADEKHVKRIDHPVLTENWNQLVIDGTRNLEPFQELIHGETDTLDKDEIGQGVVEAAQRLTEGEDIGAIIFECTNFRPYVYEVQEETGLPVFDFLTLSDMAWRAAHGTRY